MNTVTVDEKDYREVLDSNTGWCTVCEAFTREMTEPDAEGYDCPSCEQASVVGAEQALLLGCIEVA
jgi:hypothetical protein